MLKIRYTRQTWTQGFKAVKFATSGFTISRPGCIPVKKYKWLSLGIESNRRTINIPANAVVMWRYSAHCALYHERMPRHPNNTLTRACRLRHHVKRHASDITAQQRKHITLHISTIFSCIWSIIWPWTLLTLPNTRSRVLTTVIQSIAVQNVLTIPFSPLSFFFQLF